MQRSGQFQEGDTVYRGLCRTCVGRATCTYPRPKDRQVMFCAEFDGEVLNPAKPFITVSGIPWEPRVQMAEQKRERSSRKGLCRTCERGESCTFPKPPGGVWHCEEFE